MTTFNARMARQITEEALKIQRESRIIMSTDSIVRDIQLIAEKGEGLIKVKVDEDIVLEMIDAFSNMGFIVSVMDMNKLEISW